MEITEKAKEYQDKMLQGGPYIGYPRSLNAITCINEAAKNIK